MSEFKFACPVCGQHITVDSSTSGTQLDCPTCFRPFVVPQAPAAGSKLILSAKQPAAERPRSFDVGDLAPLRKRGRGPSLAGAALLLLLAGAVAALLFFRPELQDWLTRLRTRYGGLPLEQPEADTNVVSLPVPPGWTLDPAQASIPDQPAAGTIHGQPFVHDRASLTGGALSLRRGRGWPPDLALAVVLPVQKSEELSGKTIQVRADQPPPLPQVILRWKDQNNQAQQQDIQSGYLLQLTFGQAATGRISGRIFIALPDAERSIVSGRFDAEIRPVRPRP